MFHAVQFQVAGAQQQPGFALAAQQSAAAGSQFVQAEGLGHKVVGAAVETAHARLHLLASGKHQNRQIGVDEPDLLEHLFAVHHRQAEIQDGQIGQLLPEGFHGPCAIGHYRHAMPIGLEPAGEKHSQCSVVVCNQQSHFDSLRQCGIVCRSACFPASSLSTR